jgi:hypothetical protein
MPTDDVADDVAGPQSFRDEISDQAPSHWLCGRKGTRVVEYFIPVRAWIGKVSIYQIASDSTYEM